MWWIRLDSALAGAEYVTESKCLAIVKFKLLGGKKRRLQEHRFPDLDFNTKIYLPPSYSFSSSSSFSFYSSDFSSSPFLFSSCLPSFIVTKLEVNL